MRNIHIGRNGHTAETLQRDIDNIGLPILRQTEKIIDYFKPKYYFIENPQTGRMKEYIDKPFYDVDYCMYSDWGYKKRTRVWTNVLGFTPKTCKKDCPNMESREEQNTNLISAISVSSKMAIKSYHYHRNHFVKNTKTLKNSEEEGYH